MYALLFTRIIIENVLKGQKIKDIDYSQLTPERITMARKETIAKIHELRAVKKIYD